MSILLDKLIKQKRFLGCNESYMDLLEHLDSESYYCALKNEQGELWPFLTEVELQAGEVVGFFKVRRWSWFVGYLLLFESVEDLNEYMRLKDGIELGQIEKYGKFVKVDEDGNAKDEGFYTFKKNDNHE